MVNQLIPKTNKIKKSLLRGHQRQYLVKNTIQYGQSRISNNLI